MENIDKLKELIKTPKNISIIVHKYPDADAIGAALAASEFLQKKGHRISIISPNPYPKFLSWMNGIRGIIDYTKNPSKALDNIKNSDVTICVDFSCLNRVTEEIANQIQKSNTIVVIDHHLYPDKFEHISFWDTTASSTTMILYDIITQIDGNITETMGECIYAGIITDTGLFQNPNTNAKAHLITSKLFEIGIDHNKICNHIYKSNSINKIKFIGFALSNRLVIMPKEKTAYFYIKMGDQQMFKLEIGDTEGLVNYGLTLDNINLSAIMIEKQNEIRISLRSVGNIKVNEIAKNYFEGGGHLNAAGGRSNLTMEQTIKQFEEIIKSSHFTLN